MRRWNGAQAGVAAVELTLLMPVLVAAMLFVVGLGRIVTARGDVEVAARDAARAASLVRDLTDADEAARAAAGSALTGGGVRCRGLEVRTDTAAWTAEAMVAVEVACTVDLADVALVGLPGTKELRARSVAPLDVYRGGAR
ncbi:MAG: pilus assembly protein [Actinomycetota bacterium]|nr:pilus assembly protein [Actinomycetota bacterium]